MKGKLFTNQSEVDRAIRATIDKYKGVDYVQAYSNYYLGDKKRFAKYTNRKPPEFMQ